MPHAAPRTLPTLAVFTLWATLVLITLAHHEFWRDEVGALSLAIESPSLWTVPLTIHGESHPALWYLLLRGAYELVHANWVLPAVSFTVAAAAILIFLLRAPFPPWWKALFVVSVLPLYEYSVMARNYGISMLLMFAFAATYVAGRYRPLLLGVLLFLLANTNVQSAMLTGGFLAIWLGHRVLGSERAGIPFRRRLDPRTALAMLLPVLGVVTCFLTVYPTYNDLIDYQVPGQRIYLGIKAMLLPGAYFGDLLHGPTTIYPRLLFVFDSLVLYALCLGLLIDPILCAVAVGAAWVLALFFAEIYPGALRHEGLYFIFVVTLYWIAAARRIASPLLARIDPPRAYATRVFGAALSIFLPLVLLPMVVRGGEKMLRDVDYPVTESAAAARLLESDSRLHDAIVIAEPDYVAMPLHYYVGNAQYLVRERRFGNSVRFARSSILDLSLGELLDTARRLERGTGRPVVILLGHDLRDSPRERVERYSYGWIFRYSPRELAAFRAATEHLARLRHAPDSDENYDVYLVKS